jgi:DNA repair protein RecN (Recombination protein N)
MLCEIRIENFAIIDRLEVRFEPGFNVITGETGAGKSIIIDAVDLLLGGRGDADFIRAGTDRAVVEGVFEVPKALKKEIKSMLDGEGIDPSETPNEVILTRELRSNGRNTCRVNGSNASLQFFRTLGEKLVDIHGQSEHLSLLRPREHISLLDRYANLEDQRSAVTVIVHKLNQVRSEISNLEQDEAALARRVDMLGYQIEEIKAVAPDVDEEEILKEERTRLANAEQLASLTTEVKRALIEGSDDTTPSAVDLLGQAAVILAKLAKVDPVFEEQQALAESLAVQTEELGQVIRTYNEKVEYNPSRLAEVEERLDALNRLKRKYGGTIEAVLAYAEKAAKDLSDITHSEERLEELRQQEETLLHQIGDLASRLSRAREGAAETLSRGIETEMQELRMEGARFEVAVSQLDDPSGCYVGEHRFKFDGTGIDHVEFMIAANRGEPLRPLAKVASGGETARVMLALKGVLSRADSTPTLIFDEIDQGIGGRVGATVGQKLWNLSDGHQVLCVTHLAQLAGFGDAHYRVLKDVRAGRMVTSIAALDDRARVQEMAEMLGAETPSAQQSAHDILMLARRVKEGKGIQSPLM